MMWPRTSASGAIRMTEQINDAGKVSSAIGLSSSEQQVKFHPHV